MHEAAVLLLFYLLNHIPWPILDIEMSKVWKKLNPI